jgi:CheY-like chemotaxis protein
MIAEMLAQLGHRTELVDDGQKVVAAVEARRYDLVLMDVQIPTMDGVATTKAIRALGSPSNAVPIVAMTANALVSDRDAYISAGMNDYISKPIRREALVALLARLQAGAGQSVALDDRAEPDLATAESALESMRACVSSARFGEFLQLYFTAAETHLARLPMLADRRDFPALAEEAHSLRNSAGSVGASGLAALAQRLQHACHAGNAEEAGALVGSIAERLPALSAALRARYAPKPG